ncbi:MAG: hypothetical protein V2A58_01760 [Planctomycetota bacterium]
MSSLGQPDSPSAGPSFSILEARPPCPYNARNVEGFPMAFSRKKAVKLLGEFPRGASDAFRAYLFAGEHSLSDDVKGEAYGWLDRFLR